MLLENGNDFKPSELLSIQRKYDTLESLAIEVVAILGGSHDEGDLMVVLDNARSALSFDPLKSHEEK